jgi:hypothetical protein
VALMFDVSATSGNHVWGAAAHGDCDLHGIKFARDCSPAKT